MYEYSVPSDFSTKILGTILKYDDICPANGVLYFPSDNSNEMILVLDYLEMSLKNNLSYGKDCITVDLISLADRKIQKKHNVMNMTHSLF